MFNYKFLGKTIVVSYDCKPIPDRNFDYCAYIDGDEERQHYGYGKTEIEAVLNLIEEYIEDFE